jgi:hypothetical protein
MRDPRINLKDPWLAAMLSWLVPGLGHFYQGRTFKGTIYSVCILGLFLSGWAMADWSAVQPPDVRQPLADKTLLLKYTAQLGVGLPSLYGLVQSKRFYGLDNRPATTIAGLIEADFDGSFLELSPNFDRPELSILLSDLDVAHHEAEGPHWPLDRGVPAAGTIALSPTKTDNGTPAIKGEFAGTIQGKAVDVELTDVALEEPIRSNPRRRVFAVAKDAKSGNYLGILVASIPRPVWDFLSVPMSPREENLLHGKHGNFLEIWMVFTWIAGLLNMLAVWDAFDGPAYAYGDEEPSPGDKPDSPEDAPGKATMIVNKAPAPA